MLFNGASPKQSSLRTDKWFFFFKGSLSTSVLTYRLIPYYHERVREEAIRSHFQAPSIHLCRLGETTNFLSRVPTIGISGKHLSWYLPRHEKRACVQMLATWHIYGFYLRDTTALVQITWQVYNRVRRLSPADRISDVCGKVRLAVPVPDISVLLLWVCYMTPYTLQDIYWLFRDH